LNYIEKWKTKKVTVKCSQCGKVNTIDQNSYFVNKRNHDGVYLCRTCSLEYFKKSYDHIMTIDYVRGDEESRVKRKLKRRNILLLNHPIDKRGIFPSLLDKTKLLELKCTKCGFTWTSSMFSTMKCLSGCPLCSEVNGEKRKIQRKENLRKRLQDKNIELLSEDFNGLVESSEKYTFRCNVCGHVWDSRIREIVYKETPCPVCRKRNKKLEKINEQTR